MTLKDDSEHIYVVYYIGKSIELVQGDYARIIAMPIEYSSYKNLENNSVLSLVMVASVAENSDQKEITNGYFSDEPDYSGIAENTNTQDDYSSHSGIKLISFSVKTLYASLSFWSHGFVV